MRAQILFLIGFFVLSQTSWAQVQDLATSQYSNGGVNSASGLSSQTGLTSQQRALLATVAEYSDVTKYRQARDMKNISNIAMQEYRAGYLLRFAILSQVAGLDFVALSNEFDTIRQLGNQVDKSIQIRRVISNIQFATIKEIGELQKQIINVQLDVTKSSQTAVASSDSAIVGEILMQKETDEVKVLLMRQRYWHFLNSLFAMGTDGGN